MKKSELEFTILDILERVSQHQPIEDDRVELKSEWLHDSRRAARRIAAHANAARGEPILWLVGVDEKLGVVGADFEELSNWYHAVVSHFDDHIAPELTSLNVAYQGKTVAALWFSTDRAPYVVNTDSRSEVQKEVPWREGNSTRSAGRSDLLKILVPIQRNPDVELLDGELVIYKTHNEKTRRSDFEWKITLRMYFTSFENETSVIPYHRCKLELWLSDHDKSEFNQIRFHPIRKYREMLEDEEQSALPMIRCTDYELIVQRAGMVLFEGDIKRNKIPSPLPEEIKVRTEIIPARSDIPMILTIPMTLIRQHHDRRIYAKWKKPE